VKSGVFLDKTFDARGTASRNGVQPCEGATLVLQDLYWGRMKRPSALLPAGERDVAGQVPSLRFAAGRGFLHDYHATLRFGSLRCGVGH
jgi:hypothetical protein